MLCSECSKKKAIFMDYTSVLVTGPPIGGLALLGVGL